MTKLWEKGTQFDKKIEKVICIAADITNEKRLEEKANKEKLEVQMMLKILNKPVEFLNLVEDCQEIFVIHYKDEVIDVEFLLVFGFVVNIIDFEFGCGAVRSF